MFGRSANEPFRVRSLTLPAYVPAFLFAVGEGSIGPVVALLALDLGASPVMAGAIVGIRGVGTMLFDVPAGLIVARFGERRVMVVATAVVGSIAFVISSGPSLVVYTALMFFVGITWSVWTVARITFVTEATPTTHRGRAMSMMGGVNRMGLFVGPLIGGFAVAAFGLTAPFAVQAVFLSMASLILWKTTTASGRSRSADILPDPALWRLLRDHRHSLGTAGAVAVTIEILRSARLAIVPLWGHSIGLSATQISVVFAVTSVIELLVFYPVGALMDAKGRKWAAIPFLSLFSAGMLLIPLSSDFNDLLFLSLLLGIANGFGAGIIMTLGSDLSPSQGRSQFLGLWRLVSDAGAAGGPMLVAVTMSLASLGIAAVVVGAVGLTGAAVLWTAVPETLPSD